MHRRNILIRLAKTSFNSSRKDNIISLNHYSNRVSSIASSSLYGNFQNGESRKFFSQNAATSESNKNGNNNKPNVFDVNEEKVKKLTTEILSLNLMEIVLLVNIMEKQLGLGDVRSMVQAGAAGGGAQAAAGAGGKKGADKKDAAPAAPEKTIFELKLESFEAGDKIKVIKQVREITGLGLKEAKDLVEGAPKVLMKEVTKEQGDQLVEKLKAAGAKASLT
jgi:large subunit ribosomal protein L7/L12